MTPQGLLVKDRHGQAFLLTSEPSLAVETHRLVVLRETDGGWIPLAGSEESVLREPMIAALAEFFIGLCRVLNVSGQDSADKIARLRRAKAGRL
jgi:hypothetical protein